MFKDLVRTLNTLFLLADEALADRMINEERLASAERRVWLYEHGERHMCLAPACRTPVIGRLIFAHCEAHLDKWEMRWAEEEIETKPYTPPAKDPSEHPATRVIREATEARDLELVKTNAENKRRALSDAYDLLAADLRRVKERRAFLPQALLTRISEATERQFEAVGYKRKPVD
jgi:hypothetical protein